MTTFSQFNKKYITERISKNIGDEGTKKIVKKLLGKYSTPDDGGKSGQSKIEKELKLNNTNKTNTKQVDKLLQDINKRKSADLTRADAINRSMGTSGSTEGSGGASGSNTNTKKKYTPPSKTQSQNIQTNSVKNQVSNKVDNSRTINKEINPNVVKGTDPKTVNKKFGGSTPTGTFTDDAPKVKDLDQKITKNLTKPKQGAEIAYKNYEKKLKSIEKPKTRKPRTIVKSYTTQPKSPVDVKGTITRGLERTGLKSVEPKEKVGSKVKNIVKSKITKNIIKKTPKKLVFNRALSGLGRVAGGAFAVKDFMDTARKEKALGRGKTAARLRGASKAIGGYVGGGIGALAGGLAGGGVASAGLGIAGGIAGYSAGSKIGDQIYKTGRNLVTGKKTFKNLRKDISKGAGSVFKSPAER